MIIDIHGPLGNINFSSFWQADAACLREYMRKSNTDKLCLSSSRAIMYDIFEGNAELDAVLKDYRFTIAIENSEEPYFWTERLVSALANQTIPIYLGATKIEEFFNPDGIIRINTKSDIDKVLKMCTKEEYERRLHAVLDNYERIKKYTQPWDYLYLNYMLPKD